MNSALTSRESGACRLFYVTLHGRGNRGWRKGAGRRRSSRGRARARARRWGKKRSGGKEKRSVWIRAESDIKYIRIFSRDSPRRYGRSESWISFWWVFPFRLLLPILTLPRPPPKKPTVQSQPLNTNVNALGCLADFLLLHFALLATARPPARPPGHAFTDAFEALLENETARGCGVAFSRVLRSREELRYLSRTFSVPRWPSRATHK